MTQYPTFNGLKEFKTAGHYFELLATVNPVDVTAYDVNDDVIAVEKQVTQGYYIDRLDKTPFARLEITTGGNEAVKFTVTDGRSGTKSVPADVTDRAARLLGIVSSAKAAALSQDSAITGAAETAVYAASTTRELVFITPDETNPGRVGLGPPGGTYAACAIKLSPGDPTFVSNVGARAAWSLYPETAVNHTVQRMSAT